jgi:hypothetical protein
MPLRAIFVGTLLLALALILVALTDSPVAAVAVMVIGVVLMYLRYEHQS